MSRVETVAAFGVVVFLTPLTGLAGNGDGLSGIFSAAGSFFFCSFSLFSSLEGAGNEGQDRAF